MRYAIVKDVIPHDVPSFSGMTMQFSKFHNTLEEAQNEASRLCMKEGRPFLILMVCGTVQPAVVPTRFMVEPNLVDEKTAAAIDKLIKKTAPRKRASKKGGKRGK